jgi:hypothetical protein
MKMVSTLMLSLYMSGGAVFKKLPAIPRMPKKHRGFHQGTQHQLGSSLSHYPPPPQRRQDEFRSSLVEILQGEVLYPDPDRAL